MRTEDIFNILGIKKLDYRYSWKKNYDNGTRLAEYKIFKTRRHKKPIAFIQIGFNINNSKVIGVVVTYVDSVHNTLDCENITEFIYALNRLL